MTRKKITILIISGLIVIGLAIALIINIVTDPGINIAQAPVDSGDTSPTSTISPKIEDTDQPDTDNQTPTSSPEIDVTIVPSPDETDIETGIPDEEPTTVGILQLDEINVIGVDNINVINDLDKDISEILKRNGEPDYREVFYAADAYIYGDITYLTLTEEGIERIKKIFVRAPYKFEEFEMGNSVATVESMFGQPNSKGYSEEDGLWFMVYKTEYYRIMFYSEHEFGDVIAMGFEKDTE